MRLVGHNGGMWSRVSRGVALVVMTLAAVVMAHDLIYVTAHGPGDGLAAAMREAGHDGYWLSFSTAVGGVSGCLFLVALWQIRRLSILARRQGHATLRVAYASPDVYCRLVGRLWLRTALCTIAFFIAQENAERLPGGTPPPGLSVLDGQHGLALPILLATSLVVAAVAALVAWRGRVLAARVAHGRSVVGRSVSVARPPLRVAGRLTSELGRRLAGRAPPDRAISTI